MGELFENKVSKTMLMTLQAKALEGRKRIGYLWIKKPKK